jgi:hypothetical protein
MGGEGQVFPLPLAGEGWSEGFNSVATVATELARDKTRRYPLPSHPLCNATATSWPSGHELLGRGAPVTRDVIHGKPVDSRTRSGPRGWSTARQRIASPRCASASSERGPVVSALTWGASEGTHTAGAHRTKTLTKNVRLTLRYMAIAGIPSQCESLVRHNQLNACALQTILAKTAGGGSRLAFMRIR